MKGQDPFLLFAGSSHESLALELAKALNTTLGKIRIETFPDGETGVEVLQSVRGRRVFVLQSVARNPNHFLMELLIIIDALKRASAKSIELVIPYFGYARQDRKGMERNPITAKLVADLLQKAGAARVLTMDLHTEQIEGFFDIPIDNLYARPVLIKGAKNLQSPVVVSPDVGRNKMARHFAEELKCEIAIVDKRRVGPEKIEMDALIGNVKGKDVLLVDDIISTGKTLEIAAKVCILNGAKSIRALVSHALLSEKARFDGIEEVIVTNSVPTSNKQVKQVSIAPLLGEAIKRGLKGESISSMYRSMKI